VVSTIPATIITMADEVIEWVFARSLRPVERLSGSSNYESTDRSSAVGT
jgi:hypothetical protein